MVFANELGSVFLTEYLKKITIIITTPPQLNGYLHYSNSNSLSYLCDKIYIDEEKEK